MQFTLGTVALFRKKRLELNFLFWRNASKFVKFIDKENPRSFFILSNFEFYLMNECPGLCQQNWTFDQKMSSA